MEFSSILALIFSVKMPGMLAFLDSILLISHNKTILHQFVKFVLWILEQKNPIFLLFLAKIREIACAISTAF